MLKGTPIETGYYRILETRIVPKLIDWRLTPNHITYGGLLISMLAGFSFIYVPLLGGVFTLLTGLLDTLDGSLARATGQSKKFGAFLDSVLDRYTELMIYLGIWFYFYRNNAGTPYLLLILFILFGSLMVSYTRARAEGLGERCLVGVCQRGERIILLGVAGILNPFINLLGAGFAIAWATDLALKAVLVILAFGTNLTAMWRFLHVLNKLRKKI
jgi:CDP-diacylglycerol--glycerol-3-phosphate 3-phosphatidyltransferase